jgi:(p)ppGpp synthase/HD superfamily hydrolase
VLKDTNVSKEYLASIFPSNILTAIDAMTKQKGETYSDYLVRVKKNPIARVVKIADLTHNAKTERISKPTKKDIQRTEKYKQAIKFLL